MLAPGALAATSHFLKVSPGTTNPGKTVKVFGSVDHGCQIGHKNDVAIIYSKAFANITKKTFAGIPSISVSLAKSTTGSFTKNVTLSKKLKAGKYSVSGRCGGGKFGLATLKVTKPATTPPGNQFYP
jgi:hypothetical protein